MKAVDCVPISYKDKAIKGESTKTPQPSTSLGDANKNKGLEYF